MWSSTVIRTGALLVVVGTAAVPFVRAQAPARVNVGDWVSYKVNSGMVAPMRLKLTVTAVDDKHVTLRVETKLGARDLPAKEMKVDLSQLADPTRPLLPTAGLLRKVHTKKLGEGQQTLTLCGRHYDCRWLKFQSQCEREGEMLQARGTVWVCNAVPLNGIVKMVGDVKGVKSALELTGAGRGG
jgi:hypothetical protein